MSWTKIFILFPVTHDETIDVSVVMSDVAIKQYKLISVRFRLKFENNSIAALDQITRYVLYDCVCR